MTSLSVRHAVDTDRPAWDRFVDDCEHAEVYHLYAWRHVLEKAFRHRCYYLLAEDASGKVWGILPLAHLKSRLFGNFLVSLPCFNYCGLLSDSAQAIEALLSAVKVLAAEVGAEHVELRHRDSTQLDLPYRDDKVAMRRALPTSPDVLWQQFKPKLRAQIRRPAKEGAISESGGVELLDEFYAVFSRNMRDLGTPVFPRSLFAEMFRQFPDRVRLHVVRLNDQAVAGGITVQHGGTMEIPSASSLRAFNRYSVNMQLYWEALQAAIEAGCSVFDFGRSSVDAGTYRFKAQWGAEPEALRWHYCLLNGNELPQLNPQNPKFRLATRMWSHLPLAIANIVGPRIVRHLP